MVPNKLMFIIGAYRDFVTMEDIPIHLLRLIICEISLN